MSGSLIQPSRHSHLLLLLLALLMALLVLLASGDTAALSRLIG